MNKDEAYIMKKTMSNFAMVERGIKNNPAYYTPLPTIVGLKLTNRCNLRCKTCYEWNEQGYHHNLSKELQCMELDINLFKKVIDETQPMNSNIYLWGGEPLFHSRFTEISYIMERAKRISAVCTNATLIEPHMDDIVRFSYLQELLIALDGLEAENDYVRGEGTFKKVVGNVCELLRLRKIGEYKGKISIHCVLTDVMLDKLILFLEYMQELRVDTVVLCYPWYLSENTSKQMDLFYEENMGKKVGNSPSWHAFKFCFPKEKVESLYEVREKILSIKWKMKVKFQPALNQDKIEKFVMDEEEREHCYRCYSVIDRMEILPDGSVSTCKHFPEFIVGNLNNNSVEEIWNSEEYKNIRKIVQGSLMPACTKCNNLYLHGRKTSEA